LFGKGIQHEAIDAQLFGSLIDGQFGEDFVPAGLEEERKISQPVSELFQFGVDALQCQDAAIM